jgi:DNA-binding transcriptional regulator YhcF (GntR family)
MGIMPRWNIVVDRDCDEPVYAQIARQVRSRISSGELKAGAPLPSVRALASDLGVNLNTVARAYRQLEDGAFVAITGRSGVRVSPPVSAPAAKRDDLRERLRDVLARLRQAGLAPKELERIASIEITALARDEERR